MKKARMSVKTGKRKMTGAYFTVDASLVLPIVMGTIAFLLYALLFVYNRCIMETDMALIALKGAVCEAKDSDGILECMTEASALADNEKYVAWKFGELTLWVDGNLVGAKRQASLQSDDDKGWSAAVRYENRRNDPASFVRFCRRIRE